MRKSQIKFGETFGIIIIVYIIIISGFVWYNNENSKDVRSILRNDKVERSFEVYYSIVNNDLLRVSQRAVIDDEFDLVGLRAFADFAKNEGKTYLRTRLGESDVVIHLYDYSSVYTGTFTPYESLILYSNAPTEDADKEVFRTMVPVVNLIDERNDLGILEVTVYDRR